MSTTTSNIEKLRALLDAANALPEASDGTDLPTLSNPGSASDALAGKQFINQSGGIVTGTIATKTSANLSASGATVTVPAGYYAAQATKSISAVTQATPSITVSTSGLITASATQSAGYVSSGTKSGTKQLSTQGAKTVTPSTSNQTAVASGRYTIGAITVAGDSNLVSSNIKSGVSIFGVAGSYTGGATADPNVPVTGCWYLNENLQNYGSDVTVSVNFTVNGIAYSSLAFYHEDGMELSYGSTVAYTDVGGDGGWTSESMRTIDFGNTLAYLPASVYTWLQSNADNQGAVSTEDYTSTLAEVRTAVRATLG